MKIVLTTLLVLAPLVWLAPSAMAQSGTMAQTARVVPQQTLSVWWHADPGTGSQVLRLSWFRVASARK